MSSTVSFFMGFHVSGSDDKVRFNRVIKLNYVNQYDADLESKVF